VISVDTSVAHLAGALGKTVFLLDRSDTCWRWLRNRTDSPWYFSLKIHRQEKIGDWSRPVGLIAEYLSVQTVMQISADSSCQHGDPFAKL